MLCNTTTQTRDYTCVRFYVSTVSFSVLLFFNLIINWTIVREPSLRRHARFVLLFHLLVSALIHMGTSSIFYYQIHLNAHTSHSACLAMITIQVSSACNILLTLTVMALDRFCAVCHPMRYSACSAGYWPWLLGACTWMVALVIPLSLFIRPDVEYPKVCGREQLMKGELQKVIFIGVCALLILFSYVRILVEGRKLGVLNRRNRTGCRTIALHGTQLAVYILPNFVIFILSSLYKERVIVLETKELCAVVVFAFFSVAQCVAPVVYGLRKEELMEQLNRRFPCCSRYLKSLLGWTVRANWSSTQPKRERTLTAQTIISSEIPQEAEEDESGLFPFTCSSHDSQTCQNTEDVKVMIVAPT